MSRQRKWKWGDYGDDRVTVDGYLGKEEHSFDLTGRWPEREEREKAVRFAEAICAAMNERKTKR